MKHRFGPRALGGGGRGLHGEPGRCCHRSGHNLFLRQYPLGRRLGRRFGDERRRWGRRLGRGRCELGRFRGCTRDAGRLGARWGWRRWGKRLHGEAREAIGDRDGRGRFSAVREVRRAGRHRRRLRSADEVSRQGARRGYPGGLGAVGHPARQRRGGRSRCTGSLFGRRCGVGGGHGQVRLQCRVVGRLVGGIAALHEAPRDGARGERAGRKSGGSRRERRKTRRSPLNHSACAHRSARARRGARAHWRARAHRSARAYRGVRAYRGARAHWGPRAHRSAVRRFRSRNGLRRGTGGELRSRIDGDQCRRDPDDEPRPCVTANHRSRMKATGVPSRRRAGGVWCIAARSAQGNTGCLPGAKCGCSGVEPSGHRRRHAMIAEIARLEEARKRSAPWRKWGPYLSERQWGTVREDYSPGGDAWNYFSHDQARSRAYRWGEDGLAGVSDDEPDALLRARPLERARTRSSRSEPSGSPTAKATTGRTSRSITSTSIIRRPIRT